MSDVFHIFAPAGTSDIQHLRLAEVALGLDKGEWSQRLATAPPAPPAPVALT